MELWNRIRQSELGRGLMISVALHGLLVVALLVTIPWPHSEPEQPVVEVTLVDPPKPPKEAEEEKRAEPAPPEAKLAEAPEAEQKSTQQEPPSAAAQAGPGQSVPIPTLRPVFRFGEKDAGPRVSPDGNAAAEPGQAEDQPEDKPAPTETAPVTSETTGEDPQAEPAIAAPTLSLPEISLPDAALATADPENQPEAAEQTQLSAVAPSEPEPNASAAPDSAAAKKPDELAEAKKLFSIVVSGDPVAMAAVGNLPRDKRASELCTTELREQLRNATPAYSPELLPAYQLENGNVLEVREAAFRASGKWYSLHFRCTVDDDAMKVAGFAMNVGGAIPRAQWKARGFPRF